MDAANDGFIPRHSAPHGVNTPTHIQTSVWQYQSPMFLYKYPDKQTFDVETCLRRKLVTKFTFIMQQIPQLFDDEQ